VEVGCFRPRGSADNTPLLRSGDDRRADDFLGSIRSDIRRYGGYFSFGSR
jgi:hypothetical protein